MLKKKFLGILLGVIALVVVPGIVLAQDMPTSLEDVQVILDDAMEEVEDAYTTTDSYEDDTYEWSWDYDETNSDTYDYTYDYELDGDEAALAARMLALAGSTVFLVIFAIFGIPVYIYTSIAYMGIAKKLNAENGWFAWIPVLRCVQKFQLAGMSGWLTLAMVIPFVNIVLMFIALMKTCERRGMNKFLALLMFVPVANWVLLGILAWKKTDETVPTQPVQANPVETQTV